MQIRFDMAKCDTKHRSNLINLPKAMKEQNSNGTGLQDKLRDCHCNYREDTLFPSTSCISSSEDPAWNVVNASDSGLTPQSIQF